MTTENGSSQEALPKTATHHSILLFLCLTTSSSWHYTERMKICNSTYIAGTVSQQDKYLYLTLNVAIQSAWCIEFKSSQGKWKSHWGVVSRLLCHWRSYHNILATSLLSVLPLLPPSPFPDRSGGCHGAMIKELGHLRLVLACTTD